MTFFSKNKDAEQTTTVVDTVLTQTQQAAELAAIEGQSRLADPRTNPATRSHADALRTEQLLRALDAEHARVLRRHRVLDARAAEAERTLEAIALARRASSPARSVLALHTDKRTFMRICLAASLTLACGSAMGVEATAHALGAPTGSGIIAEIGLTGLATVAITYRARLIEHRGTLPSKSWQSKTLWALMTIPLLVSVACNLAMLNVVGASCSVFAVAFSLLSCVIADRSSAAMQERAEEVSAADEQQIRSTALGDDLFAPVSAEATPDTAGSAPQEGIGADPAAGAEAQEDSQEDERLLPDWIAAAMAEGDAVMNAVLAEIWGTDSVPESDEEDQDAPVPPAAGPGGGTGGGLRLVPKPAPEPVGVPILAMVGIDRDQAQDRPQVPEAVLPAVQARIAIGAATRKAVADYQAAHPKATIAEIAEGLGLSPTTVKEHRRALRAGGDGS